MASGVTCFLIHNPDHPYFMSFYLQLSEHVCSCLTPAFLCVLHRLCLLDAFDLGKNLFILRQLPVCFGINSYDND